MVTVLVIDDDADMRMLVSIFLNNLDYDVLEARDGIEGESIALARQPDIILLDLMMSKQDGFITCANLRSRGFAGHILVLSAVPAAKGRQKALDSGANEYMEKPINPPNLRQQLERAQSAHMHGD